MRRTTRWLAIALVVIGLGHATAAAAQNAPTVSVQDNVFNPGQVQASPGATVTWTDAGADQHTITADDGSFDSDIINPGDSFSFTFSSPGTFAYYCQIHGGPGGQGMSGTIVIGS